MEFVRGFVFLEFLQETYTNKAGGKREGVVVLLTTEVSTHKLCVEEHGTFRGPKSNRGQGSMDRLRGNRRDLVKLRKTIH